MSKKYAFFVVLFIAVLFAVSSLQTSSAKANLFRTGNTQELALAKTTSLQHLQSRLSQYGIAEQDIKVSNVTIDELNMAHTRVQQTVGGIPVLGGEAIIHLNSDGSLFANTDNLVKNVKVNIEPTLNKGEAIRQALAEYGCGDCLTAAPQVEMMVLRNNKKDHLVYRVSLRREDGSHDTAMPVYFIDAHSGEVVYSYDNLQTATATGSGSSLYSGTVSITTYLSGTTYYLEDVGRKIGTFDNRNTTASTYRFTDADNVWNAAAQRAGVDAHIGARYTYDYYLNTHGRRGIDGAGGPAYYTSIDGVTGLISSKVHYSSGYNNAFWNGQYMTYGDGDGSTFSPLTTLDIAGHEITHGVTERTAALVYSGESGALNESMSDVFGSMVERYAYGTSYSGIWKIGEQAYTPGTSGDALRYFTNTHTGNQPDHYSERYTGTADNGGVHTNSGISNYVFYLVSQGGTHHLGGSMTGIGADAAAKIWYKALTTYMTSSTNFKGARTATLNAAAALYGTGSTNYNAVATAWTLCGVN